MDTTILKTRKLNHILFSEILQKRILGQDISRYSMTNGAIGQIDLVGSTAFAVSKTSIINKLDREVEIFEAHLAGNRLDFEDEILLTRNDLIKRDLIYNIKSIAYNGKIIGRLTRVAKWLELEVLCTEGDKIIVAGTDTERVVTFCLAAAEIFKKKSQFGHEGFGFRCGISRINQDNPLYLYKNSEEILITASGQALASVEKLEALAEDKSFFIDETIARHLTDLLPTVFVEHNVYKLKGQIPVESGFYTKILNITNDFSAAEEAATGNADVNYSITTKRPIAFVSLEITDNVLEEIQKLVSELQENKILTLRIGVIKNNRISLICQASITRNPSTELLKGFKMLFNKGYKIKVGLTYDYLWTGNITLETTENSRFDVMGQSINKAARMVFYSVKQDSNHRILASEDFIKSIQEEGFDVIADNLEFMYFPAKGFAGNLKAFFVQDLVLEESEISQVLNENINFSEKVLAISRYTSELIFNKTTNHHLAINAPNFLITKILTFSNLNTGNSDPQLQIIQEEDFSTLAKVIVASITNGYSLFETYENLTSKISTLEYPRLMIEFLESDVIEDLTKLSLITFGRVYDFRIATMKFALGFSDEKISFYSKSGLIKIDEKRGFATLLPPLAYMLDIKATQEERLDLHTKITHYLWKGFKKYKEYTSEWYEKGRILILHSRYSTTNLLPDGLKEDLVKIFEYALEKREFLDLLFFDKDIFEGIAILKKHELLYKLALIHIHFEDIFQASVIFEQLFQDKEKLSIDFFEKIVLLRNLCKLELGKNLSEDNLIINQDISLSINKIEWNDSEEKLLITKFAGKHIKIEDINYTIPNSAQFPLVINIKSGNEER